MPDAALHVLPVPYGDPLALFAPHAATIGAQLLHSAPGAAGGGRYSFLLLDPFEILTAKGRDVRIGAERWTANPFDVVQARLARYAFNPGTDEFPFVGGAAGLFGYELARHLETVRVPVTDDLGFPDMALGFYDVVTVFDHRDETACIVSTGRPLDGAAAVRRARDRAAAIRDRLGATAPAEPVGAVPPPHAAGTRGAYEDAVRRAIDYIFAGDIYQANISQRFETVLPPGVAPFALFARLTELSPVSYAAFQVLPGVTVASNSPERFVRLADPAGARRVETRPIKGTMARHADPAEDRAAAAALLTSGKDRAENVMIVDLMRNDLSKVCTDESVYVDALCALESYTGVHHLVSTVSGRLRPGHDAVDLLTACFPGGSITGAPKPRAMEVIAELEGRSRGPYCGALGYLGFDGSMDTSIAIRTLSVAPAGEAGARAVFQVGGGVVADSDPRAEYDESLAKARAFLAAVAGAA